MKRRSGSSLPASSDLRPTRRAALIWALFLLALTSWPRPPSVPILSDIPSFDKVIHGLLYGVQGWLLYRAIRWPGGPGPGLGRVLCVVGALAAFGTLDETHQAFIPGRSMEGRDALMDTLGAALGASLASGAARRRKREMRQAVGSWG
jgi:VanZ family protein